MADPPSSTTVLGDWYVNVLFWRSHVALFVNATTFVPVLIPLAPTSGVVARFPAPILELLASGMSNDEVLDDYPDLERDDLLAALEYGALAAGGRRVVPVGAA